MKAFVASMAICKSIITNKCQYCLFSQAKLLPQIRQAIFRDLLVMTNATEPFNAELARLSELLKQITNEETQNIVDRAQALDVYSLSTLLQLISYFSHQHQKPLISASSYAKLLNNYYSRFSLHNERAIINKIIDKNVNIRYISPSFVHTDNSAILNTVKVNQHHLLGLISKSKDVTIQQFMQIISPQVYNVTDLPLIHLHFLKYLYPKIPQIETLIELERVIDYLCRFQSNPILLIKHASEMMRKYLVNEGANKHPDTWFIISNCIGLFIFRASNTCKEYKNHDELKRLHLSLAGKLFQFGKQTVCLKDLLNEDVLSKIINQISQQIYEKIGKYNKLLQESIQKSINNSILRQTLKNQLQYLSSLSQNRVAQMVEIQLLPIIIKFSQVEALLDVVSLPSFTKFINSQRFITFISKYPCYPHLYKELILTLAELQGQGKKIDKSGRLQREISLFKGNINNFLNNTLKIENMNDILKRYSPTTAFRSRFESSRLWSLQGEALANKILAMRQDYSLGNMLGMLKEDNYFLRSRMRYNSQDIVINYLKKSVAGRQWSAWNWDYPFYIGANFNQTSRKRTTEKVFFYDRFTKDIYLPAQHKMKPLYKSQWMRIIKTTKLGSQKKPVF